MKMKKLISPHYLTIDKNVFTILSPGKLEAHVKGHVKDRSYTPIEMELAGAASAAAELLKCYLEQMDSWNINSLIYEKTLMS